MMLAWLLLKGIFPPKKRGQAYPFDPEISAGDWVSKKFPVLEAPMPSTGPDVDKRIAACYDALQSGSGYTEDFVCENVFPRDHSFPGGWQGKYDLVTGSDDGDVENEEFQKLNLLALNLCDLRSAWCLSKDKVKFHLYVTPFSGELAESPEPFRHSFTCYGANYYGETDVPTTRPTLDPTILSDPRTLPLPGIFQSTPQQCVYDVDSTKPYFGLSWLSPAWIDLAHGAAGLKLGVGSNIFDDSRRVYQSTAAPGTMEIGENWQEAGYNEENIESIYPFSDLSYDIKITVEHKGFKNEETFTFDSATPSDVREDSFEGCLSTTSSPLPCLAMGRVLKFVNSNNSAKQFTAFYGPSPVYECEECTLPTYDVFSPRPTNANYRAKDFDSSRKFTPIRGIFNMWFTPDTWQLLTQHPQEIIDDPSFTVTIDMIPARELLFALDGGPAPAEFRMADRFSFECKVPPLIPSIIRVEIRTGDGHKYNAQTQIAINKAVFGRFVDSHGTRSALVEIFPRDLLTNSGTVYTAEYSFVGQLRSEDQKQAVDLYSLCRLELELEVGQGHAYTQLVGGNTKIDVIFGEGWKTTETVSPDFLTFYDTMKKGEVFALETDANRIVPATLPLVSATLSVQIKTGSEVTDEAVSASFYDVNGEVSQSNQVAKFPIFPRKTLLVPNTVYTSVLHLDRDQSRSIDLTRLIVMKMELDPEVIATATFSGGETHVFAYGCGKTTFVDVLEPKKEYVINGSNAQSKALHLNLYMTTLRVQAQSGNEDNVVTDSEVFGTFFDTNGHHSELVQIFPRGTLKTQNNVYTSVVHLKKLTQACDLFRPQYMDVQLESSKRSKFTIGATKLLHFDGTVIATDAANIGVQGNSKNYIIHPNNPKVRIPFEPTFPTTSPTASPAVTIILDLNLQFDSYGLIAFNENLWKDTVAQATYSVPSSAVKIVTVILFQMLELKGMSVSTLTPQLENALFLAYQALGFQRENVVFVLKNSAPGRRRLLSGSDLSVEVEMTVRPKEAKPVNDKVDTSDFQNDVEQSLVNSGETGASLDGQKTTGLFVRFQVNVPLETIPQQEIIQNVDFVAKFQAMAISNGIIGQDATVSPIDPSKVVVKTKAPTRKPTQKPTSIIKGDPHLVGFRGQKFDILGREGGAVYNLVADDFVQLNVKIGEPFFVGSMDKSLHSGHKGLYMTDISIAFVDGLGEIHEVTVSGDFNSSIKGEQYCNAKRAHAGKCLRGLHLSVDGGRLEMSEPGSWMLGENATLHAVNNDCPFENREGPCLTFHRELGGYGQVRLEVPSFTLEVGAQFMNYHDLEMRALHHLDLSIGSYLPSGDKVGGLLGQTVAIKMDVNGQPIMQGTECYEGVEDDYIVDSLDLSALKTAVPILDGHFLFSSVDGNSA